MLSIRTQDRMALVPYDSAITIVTSYKDGSVENKMCELIMPYRISYMVLGTYATKERALAVLDEIEIAVVGKILLPTYELENKNNRLVKGNLIKEDVITLPQVYHMPKEWLDERV